MGCPLINGMISNTVRVILSYGQSYNASDMKLDASTLEVGVVKVEDKMFSKYSSQQVESYVERILENHKDETEDAEDEEAEQ